MPHRSRAKVPPLAWLLMALSLAISLIVYLQDPGYYPSIRIETGTGVNLVYLSRTKGDKDSCEQALNRIETSTKKACPKCEISQRTCSRDFSQENLEYFSDKPQRHPIAHLAEGILVFESDRADAAQAVCETTINTLKNQKNHKEDACYSASEKRPYFRQKTDWVDLKHLGFALLALVLAQLVSKFSCFLIIRYEHLHAHLSHDHSDAGPQKFHALPTPRIGGIPLMAGLLVSTTLLQSLPNQFPDSAYALLILSSLPAFLGGLTEDITKKVGVSQRLLLTILSGLFGCFLMDNATITHLDIPGIDTLLQWSPLAIAFTAFAVGGVANSVNIIDGYNGLAAGFGILASSALAFVAAQHGDSFLLYANLSMAGALIGFLVWNWPGGKIFLGDGGAYLLGFWLAEMTILLIGRNPDISVWFGLLIMIYPVFETLFTIYRRKFKHKSHPGHPDACHLHQLIYKRLVRIHIGTKDPQLKIKRNSKVAPYLCGLWSVFVLPSLFFHNTSLTAALLCLGYTVSYTALYNRLCGWKVPELFRLNEKN